VVVVVLVTVAPIFYLSVCLFLLLLVYVGIFMLNWVHSNQTKDLIVSWFLGLQAPKVRVM
jgi:hypothetical protein